MGTEEEKWLVKLLSLNKTVGEKGNRIHVLKDISLELPTKGLVAIVGESGCGKTTLLNCIGGIDNASGEIVVGSQKFGRVCEKNDCFRKENIGYIYQEYALVEQKSVKENLQIAIDVAETSGEDDDERILYVLQQVGMEKYLKRKINTLSGGQKQRIAIARAIINCPILLLADEPTGHLDSVNTHIIMNLLQRLSESMLVVWVSHERELVNRYADRIITMSDGRIVADNEKSMLNRSDNYIEETNSDKIFLDKYNKESVICENGSIDIYMDRPVIGDFKIVLSEYGIYIAAPDNYVVRSVSYDVLKDKKEDVSCDEESICNGVEPIILKQVRQTGRKSKSHNNWYELLKKESVFSLIGFVSMAFLIAFAMSFSNLGKEAHYEDYLQFHPDTVQVDIDHNITKSEIKQIQTAKHVKEILPYNDMFFFELADNNYLQTSIASNNPTIVYTSVLGYEYASEIIMGRKPESVYEVLVDERVVRALLDKHEDTDDVAMLGYTNINNFLNSKLTLRDSNISVRIVGITKSSAPTIYMCDNLITSIALKQCVSEEFDIYVDSTFSEIQPLSDMEIYINETLYQKMGCEVNDNFELAGYSFKIKGFFVTDSESDVIISAAQAERLIEEKFIKQTEKLLLMSEQPADTAYKLSLDGYSANSLLEITEQIVAYEKKGENTAKLVSTVILLLVALFICYMIQKNSIAYNKEELCVRRIVGESKWYLFLKGFWCVLKKILVISVPVYLLTVMMIGNVSDVMRDILSISKVSTINFCVGFIVYLSIAVISTVLSYAKVLKYTPAELLRKNLLS